MSEYMSVYTCVCVCAHVLRSDKEVQGGGRNDGSEEGTMCMF